MTTDEQVLTELAIIRAGMTELETRIAEHEAATWATKSYLGRDAARGLEILLLRFSDGEHAIHLRAEHSPDWGPSIKLSSRSSDAVTNVTVSTALEGGRS